MTFRYAPIWILALGQLAVLLLWTTYDFFVPIFLQGGRPDFDAGDVRGFGLNPAITGVVMSLDNMAGLLILPYIGVLSDRTRTRWGRRMPYLMVGIPIAAVAFSLIPLTLDRPLPFFMGAIILTLLTMDLIRTPLTALMPDLTPPSHRSPANGIITFMQGVGAILGFVVGGWLFRQSPAAPFLFTSAVLVATTFLVVALVREPAQPEEGEQTPSLLASLSTIIRDRDRSAMLLLVSLFSAWLAFSGNRVFFSRYAISALHLDPGVASRLMGLFAGAMLVGALPAGLLGARFGRRRVILVGFALCGCGMAANYVVESIPPLRLTLILTGFSFALVLVNALPLVLDHAPPARDGAYSGLYYLATQAAEVAGPILAGNVLHLVGDARALFLYTPAALLVALAFMLGVRGAGAVRRPAAVRP